MLVDLDLVTELEISAARDTVATLDSLVAADPSCGAAALPVGDGAAIAAGAGRYVNRAMGVTVGSFASDDLDEIERFFAARGLASLIELSPWAAASTVAMVRDRGYRPEWFRSVFATTLPVGDDEAPLRQAAADGVRVAVVDDDGTAAWLEALAVGNAIDEPARRAVSDEWALAARRVAGVTDLVALVGDEVAGCGSLHVVGPLAWVGAAATIPAFRRLGVQAALLRARLEIARDAGCTLAAATAVTDGTSARNLVRCGFTHVQTQVVVSRPVG